MEPVPPERMPGERPFEGRTAYEQALDELIANAAHTVRIFDRNIGRGFNSPQRCELLRRLLLARRANRVCLVLHDTANIVRDCPRLIVLLRQFSQGVRIRQTLPEARGGKGGNERAAQALRGNLAGFRAGARRNHHRFVASGCVTLEIMSEMQYNSACACQLTGRPVNLRANPLSVKGRKMNRSLLIAALLAVGLTACGGKP